MKGRVGMRKWAFYSNCEHAFERSRTSSTTKNIMCGGFAAVAESMQPAIMPTIIIDHGAVEHARIKVKAFRPSPAPPVMEYDRR